MVIIQIGLLLLALDLLLLHQCFPVGAGLVAAFGVVLTGAFTWDHKKTPLLGAGRRWQSLPEVKTYEMFCVVTSLF